MPAPNIQSTFLMRPRPAVTESVRSLLHRLAMTNRLPLRMLGEPGRIVDASASAYKLAPKADWDGEKILRHGALTWNYDLSDVCVSIGRASLGRRCFVGSQRRICPICIRDQAWTPIDWEIRINDACHIHQCTLIDKCSGCGAPISWLSHKYECGRCALPWSEFETHPASISSTKFAKSANASIVHELREFRLQVRSKKNVTPLGLEKLLLMVDVLRYEILRRWLSPKLWREFSLIWSIDLLRNVEYRRWLWSEIFLHAAKDPMTLAKALHPTGSALKISTYFNGFASAAPVPSLIISSLKKLGEQEVLRSLSSRPIFDARLHGIYGVFQAPERELNAPGHQDDEDWDEENGPQSELKRFVKFARFVNYVDTP